MRANSPLLLLLATSCLATPAPAQNPPPVAPTPRLGDLRGVWDAHFNHDSSRVIVRLRDGGVSLWDAATGTPVTGELPLDKPAEHHVMSTEAKLVLIGFEDGAQVFDGTTGAAVSPLLKARLKNDLQTPALFSPDGETAIIFGGSEAFVWRVRAGQLLARIPTPAREGEEAPPAAFFTRDGAHCFVLDRQGTVTRYDAKSWKQSGKPMRHPAAELAYEFAFAATADGKWLATFDHPGENGPKRTSNSGTQRRTSRSVNLSSR